MIESLLIANRGEIACRIIRTARRLGIRTIAVYSTADGDAPFVREADAAVPIGAAPARDSYLDSGKILAAAAAGGAAAIHPGYGFLSENAAFAEAVLEAGLIWVGAPPAAIRAMGLKDAAKALMIEAQVPVTPGYLGANQDPQHLKREAAAIGYPVLLKAVAGGGGKGMRRVDEAREFEAALASCRREAGAAFGDERVLIEKYILSPRHIEVQVFGDSEGRIVHLFERDCSLQRRHQKVVEEAPAPGLDAGTREFLCGVAVRAARAVNYVGAGTIEFIADASHGLSAEKIWFMEMNTRLQVEHPVTEAITGQDLVEWQLRVAGGEPLPRTQSELKIDGWAIEARLYAENPTAGFLPSIGPVRHLRLPDSVRVDSGIEQGGEVTGHYDPMIAKLIAHAPNRSAAARQLAAACAAVEVWPVRTNAAFLARVAEDAAFVAGAIDTGFIERRAALLIPAAEPGEAVVRAAARALVADQEFGQRNGYPSGPPGPWTHLVGFRSNAAAYSTVDVAVGDRSYSVDVDAGAAEHGTAVATRSGTVDTTASATASATPSATASATPTESATASAPPSGTASATESATSLPTASAAESATASATIITIDGRRVLFHRGEAWGFGSPTSARVAAAAAPTDGALQSPMPGRVVSVSVRQGQTVTKGQALVSIEAMKMEHALMAPFDGTVAEVSVSLGDQVAENVVLVRIAP